MCVTVAAVYGHGDVELFHKVDGFSRKLCILFIYDLIYGKYQIQIIHC